MASAPDKSDSFHRYPWYAPRFWHGMTAGTWWKFLARHGFRLGLSRANVTAAVSLISLGNSVAATLQSVLLNRRIAAQPPAPPPIFILGHWRSGTTHLHELLIHDPRFGYPTTYECFAPNHFLLTEWVAPALRWLLPSKRPMDNMPAGWEHPQEDEFALCNLGLGSPYERMGFPNDPPQDEDFLRPERETPAAYARWQAGFRWFVERVQYRQPGKQLVFKSPPHTARIGSLLELYPNAKFIHIVRDPVSVYPSTLRLWKSLFDIQGLSKPTFAGLEEYVLRNFERMYENFERDRGRLNDENFYELKYEDLVREPLTVLAGVYEILKLGDFGVIRPQIEAYLDSQKSYQTNRHQMDPQTLKVLRQRWGRWMQPYGYLTEEPATTENADVS